MSEDTLVEQSKHGVCQNVCYHVRLWLVPLVISTYFFAVLSLHFSSLVPCCMWFFFSVLSLTLYYSKWLQKNKIWKKSCCKRIIYNMSVCMNEQLMYWCCFIGCKSSKKERERISIKNMLESNCYVRRDRLGFDEDWTAGTIWKAHIRQPHLCVEWVERNFDDFCISKTLSSDAGLIWRHFEVLFFVSMIF